MKTTQTETGRGNQAGLSACAKCGGSGTITAFAHVVGGTCFACGGSGTVRARPVTSVASVTRTRAWWIGYFGEVIRAGRSHAAQVDKRLRRELLDGWRDMLISDLAEGSGHLHCLTLEIVPVDVRERARLAFAALGVSL